MWKSSCLRYLALLVCVVAPPAHPETEARSGVFGVWVSPKGTIFSITENAGQLQAEILAMRKPRLDKKNPVAELRDRPVVGLQVLSNYEFKRGAWRGRIYDPASGHTFKSYMKRDADGSLRVRGYVGLALFGKTQVFEPVRACTEQTVGVGATLDLGQLC